MNPLEWGRKLKWYEDQNDFLVWLKATYGMGAGEVVTLGFYAAKSVMARYENEKPRTPMKAPGLVIKS